MKVDKNAGWLRKLEVEKLITNFCANAKFETKHKKLTRDRVAKYLTGPRLQETTYKLLWPNFQI